MGSEFIQCAIETSTRKSVDLLRIVALRSPVQSASSAFVQGSMSPDREGRNGDLSGSVCVARKGGSVMAQLFEAPGGSLGVGLNRGQCPRGVFASVRMGVLRTTRKSRRQARARSPKKAKPIIEFSDPMSLSRVSASSATYRL